jgi:hypothetical protein
MQLRLRTVRSLFGRAGRMKVFSGVRELTGLAGTRRADRTSLPRRVIRHQPTAAEQFAVQAKDRADTRAGLRPRRTPAKPSRAVRRSRRDGFLLPVRLSVS